MVLLALRNAFQQSIICFYLEKQGFQVACPASLSGERHLADTPVIVLTDDLTKRWATAHPAYLIWLVNAEQGFPFSNGLPEAVRGVLCTESHADELLTCLQLVQAGKHYVSSQVFQSGNKVDDDVDAELYNQLSKREKEVFALIQEGLSVSKIADRLFISVHTAENHRANIQKKLSLSGRLSLVRYATLARQRVK
jgi:DNA-binding NarL/FixJ family response regulator